MTWITSFFFLIFSFLFLNADETKIDVENLPFLRSMQYSMGPYKKIVVFSAPRTGSSLAYNILRFLFQNEQDLSIPHNEFNPVCNVLKTHRIRDIESLKGENTLYIVPIRAPLEACISTYRIHFRPINNLQNWCKDVVDRQVRSLLYSEKLQSEGGNVFFIKYEDFCTNFDYLLTWIEDHFNLTIGEEDTTLIRNGYRKENVFSNVDSLDGFEEYLPVSGFHGNHVSLEDYTPPDQVVYHLKYYLKEAEHLYQKYGYTQMNSKLGQ